MIASNPPVAHSRETSNPRLFIDCTHTWHSRSNTGIQRVVRNLATYARGTVAGVVCQPVIWAGVGFVPIGAVGTQPSLVYRTYRFGERAAGVARRVLPGGVSSEEPKRLERSSFSPLAPGRVPLSALGALARQMAGVASAPRTLALGRKISFRPGDRLLLADAHWHHPQSWGGVERAQEQGAKITPLFYDLIPVRLPETFEAGVVASFRRWLAWVLPLADDALAISRATADDVHAFLAENPALRETPLPSTHYRLGADLDGRAEAEPSREITDRIADHAARKEPLFLMVATLEPRKNHGDLLTAIDRHWQRGGAGTLILAGRVGWLSGEIIDRIEAHPERGRRLIHRSDLTDADLEALYSAATATICPSALEGFGLPIVEAQSRGSLVVASDIPVHREVGGETCRYFPLGDATALAEIIQTLAGGERCSPPTDYRWPKWEESTIELVERLSSLDAAPIAPSTRSSVR